MRPHDTLFRYAAPLLTAGAIAVAPSLALGLDKEQKPGVTPTPTEQDANQNTPEAARAERRSARELVDEATAVVERMQADSQLAGLLRRAKGVYIVPDFGRAALGVGGEGGAGVMLSHTDGEWSGPAFYDMGGLTVGLEAGVSGGEVAFILMSDKAVENFKQRNAFSLSADAGYNVLNYNANAGTSWGRGDIVTWSDTEGLFAGAGVGVADVRWNADRNDHYHGGDATPDGVLAGKMSDGKAGRLKQALPS